MATSNLFPVQLVDGWGFFPCYLLKWNKESGQVNIMGL
jgi:hypothetical protein